MQLTPLGDSALVLSWGGGTDAAAFRRARTVADALRGANLEGTLDVVPAFSHVTLFYDIARVGSFRTFEQRLRQVAEKAENASLRAAESRVVDIPVCYGGEYGPDLELVADHARVNLGRVIELHSRTEYVVQAIGFVPGFAYLGGLPKALHTPRRATPRTLVPAGSVALAGDQAGVYPLGTPGGWNIVGQTPVAVFDPFRRESALLKMGDRVHFRPITPEEFRSWK